MKKKLLILIALISITICQNVFANSTINNIINKNTTSKFYNPKPNEIVKIYNHWTYYINPSDTLLYKTNGKSTIKVSNYQIHLNIHDYNFIYFNYPCITNFKQIGKRDIYKLKIVSGKATKILIGYELIGIVNNNLLLNNKHKIYSYNTKTSHLLDLFGKNSNYLNYEKVYRNNLYFISYSNRHTNSIYSLNLTTLKAKIICSGDNIEGIFNDYIYFTDMTCNINNLYRIKINSQNKNVVGKFPTITHLLADEKYLYIQSESTIYRCNLDGSHQIELVSKTDFPILAKIENGWVIYFSNLKEYKIKNDGTQKQLINP